MLLKFNKPKIPGKKSQVTWGKKIILKNILPQIIPNQKENRKKQWFYLLLNF